LTLQRRFVSALRTIWRLKKKYFIISDVFDEYIFLINITIESEDVLNKNLQILLITANND